MTIAEQALSLLDLPNEQDLKKNFSLFPALDDAVIRSLEKEEPAPLAELPGTGSKYTVASRMANANYDEEARVEALMNALKKIRTKHVSTRQTSGRIIRNA